MPKLKITETVLRDGQQSLAGARMTAQEMVPILPTLDRVGFHSIEVFGGATFDTSLRYLGEDPWEKLRSIRANMPSTPLQMLFRGQSALGYRHYPDDIVSSFIQRAGANGISVVRVYDALNDYRNLETAIRAAKRERLIVQAAICYTTSPVHSTETFVSYAKALLDLGADSLCIKDMAGILRPYDAYQLIKALRAELPMTPIQLHTHATAGLASMTILKAVEVGIDIIDTAISPFAEGASLPATESVAAAFVNTPYATSLDTAALSEASEYFSHLRARYIKKGLIDPAMLRVDEGVLLHQMPTGTYSALFSQLCRLRAKDHVPEVYNEIVRVRADAGYPPMVTPIAQIVAMQALQNVLDGERYQTVTDDFAALIGGRYGRLPVQPEPMFLKQILGDTLPISHRPADTIENAVEKYRSMVAPYAEQDEDLLTLAMFEDMAKHFFEERKNRKYHLDPRASRSHAVHPF